ncbi:MAG: Na+/H+ antiporter [Bacteroidia bacterium]|jgi:CPA1 family monovalent cation:H+ antiporter|nr:Na+/H+ antiporter [Bacteroidia bacterium]
MHTIETVILLLAFVTVLALFARKLRIVFPVLLTLAGLGIGCIPGLPEITIDPSVVLLVFLPPILYSAAWYTNWKEFWSNIEPVTVLALGLVLTTCLGIAFTAWWLLPGFTLATGFLLGAIVSPPDAVAATAVLKRVRVSKKIVTVLEGESLVNDASALVAFQVALVAITTGSFSAGESVGKFFLLAGGGILVGLAVGALSYWLHKTFEMEPAIETVLTFVTAYASYIVAERLHVSGVLGAVSAGLFMGSRQSAVHKASMRIQAVAVWDFVNVVLNGIIFILIGLQLPVAVRQITTSSLPELAGYGLLISIAAIVIRFAFIFFVDTLSNAIRRKLGKPTVFPTKKHTTVLAFTAMRGIVSLAAVFSIPVLLQNGQPFPVRHEIIFITFMVVLFTLVVQGISLPWLVKALKFSSDHSHHLPVSEIRTRLLRHAHQSVKEMIEKENINHHLADKILDWQHQQLKLQQNAGEMNSTERELVDKLSLQSARARREMLHRLKKEDKIDIEDYHRIEHELDLEEAGLQPQ